MDKYFSLKMHISRPKSDVFVMNVPRYFDACTKVSLSMFKTVWILSSAMSIAEENYFSIFYIWILQLRKPICSLDLFPTFSYWFFYLRIKIVLFFWCMCLNASVILFERYVLINDRNSSSVFHWFILKCSNRMFRFHRVYDQDM